MLTITQNRVDVIVEKYLTLIQERSVYIKTQREKGLDVDEINYSKGVSFEIFRRRKVTN